MNKLLLVSAVSGILVSCAANFESDFKITKPGDAVLYEYLNSYDALKKYIDRSAYPNFKLGTGVSVDEFQEKGIEYSMVASNFDEMTAANAMKYGSCVANNGSMDFTNVAKFVNTAQEAGLSIYGHTLCCACQQNTTYLNGLIAPVIIPWEPGEEESKDTGYCLEITNQSPGAFWASQILYEYPSGVLEKDVEYEVQFMVRATNEANMSCVLRCVSDWSEDAFGWFTVTKDWTLVRLSTVCTADTRNGFLISVGELAGTVYFDNISIKKKSTNDNKIENSDFEAGHINGWGGWGDGMSYKLSEDEKGYGGSGSGSGSGMGEDEVIEKTPEEKMEILTEALQNWIDGMMEACSGYVKSWDVVNEPMDDSNPTMLKSSNNASEEEKTNNFYWQDYLGENYARIVIKATRDSYKEHGGNEADLKLFINDYGLESAGNAKCSGLIAMIEKWEADGETKIDGIGSQMHVTYYLDSEKQRMNEESIVNMYNLLKETGKLIKISELDMGIENAKGKTLTVSEITYEQELAMAEFYQFIIRKYFEIIPVSQQYGITQWSPVDASNTSSAWRSNQPIGLWYQDYSRKPAYAGFADGLSHKQ